MHERDVGRILGKRSANGGDFWASRDGRIYKGNPFSTIGALGMLHELGVGTDHEAVAGGVGLLLDACRSDGRVRVAPRAPLHPCYSAEAARILSRFGRQKEEAVQRVIDRFLATAHVSGGWRCSATMFGRGPETVHANPGATLYVLDALRFHAGCRDGHPVVDQAVGFLLDHWETRLPLGPCHWGIGTLFLQVEYPFLRYNLFFYVYVLSHFKRAMGDDRFREALGALQEKLDSRGYMVVERPHRALADLDFCARGKASEPATRRYREIVANMDMRS